MRTKIQIISHENEDDYFLDGEIYEKDKNNMKNNKASIEVQVLYLGKLVNKKYFRAFVYGHNEQKLAKNYEEYENLINSGIWFESLESLNNSKIKTDPLISEKSIERRKYNRINKNFTKIENKKNIVEVKKEELPMEVIEYGTDR